MLTDFYAARQGDSEDVASWGCRLEDLLDRAQKQGLVTLETSDEMLRTKFWSGLTRKLKDVSRYKFDSIKSFDELRVELRNIEHEFKIDSDATSDKSFTRTPAKMATASAKPTESKSEVADLQKVVSQLAATVNQMRDNFIGSSKQSDYVSVSAPGSYTPQLQTPLTQSQSYSSQPRGFTPQPPRPPRPPQFPSQNFQGDMANFECRYCHEQGHLKADCPVKQQMVCWRCRQMGHLSRDCQVRMDHSRDYHLNGREPASRGGHSASQGPAPWQR